MKSLAPTNGEATLTHYLILAEATSKSERVGIHVPTVISLSFLWAGAWLNWCLCSQWTSFIRPHNWSYYWLPFSSTDPRQGVDLGPWKHNWKLCQTVKADNTQWKSKNKLGNYIKVTQSTALRLWIELTKSAQNTFWGCG